MFATRGRSAPVRFLRTLRRPNAIASLPVATRLVATRLVVTRLVVTRLVVTHVRCAEHQIEQSKCRRLLQVTLDKLEDSVPQFCRTV